MRTRVSVIVLGLLCGLSSWAQAAPDSADLAACAACHGTQGQGNPTLGAPRLAGQHYSYLLQQLRSFKVGARGYGAQDSQGALMRSALAAVPESALEGLARHYAGLATAEPPTLAQQGSGATLYQGTCAYCHGPDARGNAHLQAPNLRLLDAAYLDRQLRNYASGWRGNAEQDAIHGPWMRSIAMQLNDTDRQAVVEYLSGQQAAEE